MNLRVRSTWMMPWGDHLWRNTLAPRPAFKKWVLLQATSTRQRPPQKKQLQYGPSFWDHFNDIWYMAENAMNFPKRNLDENNKKHRVFPEKNNNLLLVSFGRSKPSLLKAKVLQLLVPQICSWQPGRWRKICCFFTPDPWWLMIQYDDGLVKNHQLRLGSFTNSQGGR